MICQTSRIWNLGEQQTASNKDSKLTEGFFFSPPFPQSMAAELEERDLALDIPAAGDEQGTMVSSHIAEEKFPGTAKGLGVGFLQWRTAITTACQA